MEEDEIYYSDDTDADDSRKLCRRLKDWPYHLHWPLERLSGLDWRTWPDRKPHCEEANNDALEGLRMALGEKSLLFRTDIRNSKSQRTSLKAWDNVNKQDAVARRHKRATIVQGRH